MLEALDFIQRHWAIVVTVGGAVWTYMKKSAKKRNLNNA